jgi:rsbT co-antagonist protein RsbR
MQRRQARHAQILRDITHEAERANERARLVDDLKQQADELRMYQALVENTTDGVAIGTLDGGIAYANPAWRTMTGYGEEVLQMPYQALFPERELPRLMELGTSTMSGGTWQGYLTYKRKDGSEFEALVSSFLLRNAAGQPLGQGAFVRDTTEMRRNERERQQLQQEVIDAQQAAIRELSTPLIPLADGVVAMPLVGTITSERAQLIMETLLEGISEQSADVALIDITGVKMVDTQVADALLRAARAAKLLGAHIVLTGISAEVAQTLVGLGAQLTGIETRGTLREGIAFALQREMLES